jgi:PST family polysaccharide transporter
MKDLKNKTLQAGYARGGALAGNFALRMGSVMILARLLHPKDFGLLGMVTAFTGILSLFRDFGLSAAAIQLAAVTEEQCSTLFWINLLVGAILTVVAAVLAPIVSTFYHEPRLFWITTVVASGFLFNGAGVQHSAILQRQMRFGALALVDIISLILSTVIAIGTAMAGYGYWALVAMTVSLPLATSIGLWLVSRWVPGMPHRGIGIRSIMRFGGTLTLNGFVVYVASNFEKVLLGRFWGAEALGIYGRAYQLIRIPTDNLNSGVGEVAFAALSRLQDNPARLKTYFLKGYSLVLAFTLPITVACAIFANDMVSVLLGPKWKETVPIFRLLAPTILAFAIANPLGWLLSALGLVGRGLKIALVISPLMIGSYIIGLPYGPKGVAFAYSAIMTLWVLPAILWCIHGTMFSFLDILRVVCRPLVSVIPAAGLAYGLNVFFGHAISCLPRLVIECAVLFIMYAGVLLFVAGEKAFYVRLLRDLRKPISVKEEKLASVL